MVFAKIFIAIAALKVCLIFAGILLLPFSFTWFEAT
jgi:hypothetical protein